MPAYEGARRGVTVSLGAVVSAASGAAPAPAPAAEVAPQQPRDPLYREFLEWRASRSKATSSR